MRVQLELAGMPEISKLPKIFDTEKSWAMFRDGNKRYLTMPHERPIFIARITEKLDEATVYCDDRLIDKTNQVANPLHYPLDQILMMYILAKNRGALFHAAGIGVGGKGVVFPGRSGAGKTTITRQFMNSGIEVFSDERIVLKKIDGRYLAFGTPWPGDAKIAVNRSLPLTAIFFIHHGNGNKIKDISPRRAFEKMMPIASIPWFDAKFVELALINCENLANTVPAYELCFKPDNTIVETVQNFVAREFP